MSNLNKKLTADLEALAKHINRTRSLEYLLKQYSNNRWNENTTPLRKSLLHRSHARVHLRLTTLNNNVLMKRYNE